MSRIVIYSSRNLFICRKTGICGEVGPEEGPGGLLPKSDFAGGYPRTMATCRKTVFKARLNLVLGWHLNMIDNEAFDRCLCCDKAQSQFSQSILRGRAIVAIHSN